MNSQGRAGTLDGFAAEVTALKNQLEQIAASMESASAGETADASPAIREKARSFLARATALLEHLGSDVGAAAGPSVRAAAEHAKATAGEGVELFEDVIRHRPLTAVAVAFGVGCLVSLLLRRH